MQCKLYDKKPNRLFTFGCSFTDYIWSTWANILGYELNCEFYNLGRTGAGNFYIALSIAQANAYFNFDKNDLIIVSWTNIAREDRFLLKKGWITPGNIYTQHEYNDNFVNKLCNQVHFGVRDFSLISMTYKLLKNKSNIHMLQMLDIQKILCQWDKTPVADTFLNNLLELYSMELNMIQPSFYEVLWDNNLDSKINKNKKEIHELFTDAHPSILEHYEYLTNIFDYKFSNQTEDLVNTTYENFVINTKNLLNRRKEPYSFWLLDKNIRNKYLIKKSNNIPQTLLL